MIVALLLSIPVFAISSEPGYMRISLIKGGIQMKTPEAADWGFASINTPLVEGDQVWVPEGGRAELQLNGGTYLRLDQNSSLQILSIDKDSSQFYLSQGHAYIFYDAPKGSVIQIDTPDASTRAFNRAVFRIDIGDKYTDAAVFKGDVETENNTGTTRINAGQLLSLGINTNGEMAALDSPDSWEKWNRKQDARVNAKKDGSARFLPAELRTYSSDLDANGRWVFVPEHGNVWTPTVITGAAWSPYREGRWLPRNGESVWVADEPWGWAPYHYGRWSFVANVGWCWVPPVAGEVHWGPGYVGWVRTADYVAWVPLAPGEIYYGRGNYGPHSVNITTVNINSVRVVNIYRNVNVSNGVTIVRRNSFNTASPAIVHVDRNNIRKNIFVTNNISIGAPDIKPSRGAHYPSAGSIPSDKLPPLRVRNLHPQEMKHERLLVRENYRSVLSPTTQPKILPVNRVDTPRTPGKERPELRQIHPTERRKSETLPGALPRVERPQVRPVEQRKPESMPGSVPRVEQPRVKPVEQRKPETLPGAVPRVERSQVRPVEQRKPESMPGSVPRVEQPRVKPVEQRKPEVLPGAVPRVERPQVRPVEQRKPESMPGSVPRVEQPRVKPVEQRKPEVLPGAVPRVERPQIRPVEQRKPEALPVPVQRGEQPKVQPAETRKVGTTGGHAPKDEKDAPKSDEDSRSHK